MGLTTLKDQTPLSSGSEPTSDLIVDNAKCRRCMHCIQTCPSKAIKFERETIKIISERCILCGNCIASCPQQAVDYKSGLDNVTKLLSRGERTIACLDPAFPAILNMCTPGQLVTLLKKIGFTEVWEGAFGAELVNQTYKKLLSGETDKTLISSFCPATVFYIQKYLPQLIPGIVPVVSPMIAIGRVAKKIRGPGWKTVYITPCLAHALEMRSPEVAGAIDEVITFRDVKALIAKSGIDIENLPETAFEGPKPFLGRVASVIGGLYQSTAGQMDLLMMDHVSVTYGHKPVIGALNQLAAGLIKAKFVDFIHCFGCVDGPFAESEMSLLGRRQTVVRYAKTEMSRQDVFDVITELDTYADLDLHREFHDMEQKLPIPEEEEITAILKRIRKDPPSHNLDCRACGYPTCRDKAIAVAQGITEAEYCLPYLLQQSKKIYQELKRSHKQLQLSHQQLEEAQTQLIKTEKMASLGQLAAGVAHEINNPLGTITIYSHLLLKGLEADDPRKEDVELIISEAKRAKEIVQGLLSFARDTKLSQTEMNMNHLLEDVFALVANQSLFYNIKVEKSFYEEIPTIHADETKLKQVFLNIILNGAQAMEGNGRLTISTIADKKQVKVKIQDTGPGIPPENMGKLFSPFYTTKEKGTGLGLAISYGIIERHGGRIDVDSELGKGSTFTITLPISGYEEAVSEETQFDKISAQNKLRGRKDHGPKTKNFIS
jgi:signal transduction histidine kinase/iron only hydrogenase large subunit-like protein